MQYSTVVDHKNGRTIEPLHERNRKVCCRATCTLLHSSGFTEFGRPSKSEHRGLQSPAIFHFSTKIIGGGGHERHRSKSSRADSDSLRVLLSFSAIFSSRYVIKVEKALTILKMSFNVYYFAFSQQLQHRY